MQLIQIFVPFSVVLYLASYLISALLYPGGHHHNWASVGFSWLHNYGCDLFKPYAFSGRYHRGYWVARLGLIILLAGLSTFFLCITTQTVDLQFWLKLIQAIALISMMAATCIFSRWHNAALIVSFSLLLVSVTGLIAVFWIENRPMMVYQLLPSLGIGSVCFFMWLYAIRLQWVPLIQKVALVLFLYWVLYVYLFRIIQR